MKTYIAFLRGINVAGQKKIKMLDLRSVLENSGLKEVSTYIQSGNIIFTYKEIDIDTIADSIKNVIITAFGFEVPVHVMDSDALLQLYRNNPFYERVSSGEIAPNKMYFTMLSGFSMIEKPLGLQASSYAPEEFIITQNAVYFFAANGYGKTKLTNNFFEKKLSCFATTRNLNTIRKLLELMKVSF